MSAGLKLGDIKAGEKFRVRMSPNRLGLITWWAFGDLKEGLRDIKFARWQRPDSNGVFDDLMYGQEAPEFERVQNDVWVFSERLG